MFIFVLTAVALLSWGTHTIIRLARGRQASLGLALRYIFGLVIGVGGIYGFTGHAFFADSVATSIGWPPGNPFQTEVAVVNLTLGLLGLCCLRFDGDFWLATAIAWGSFFLGAGVVHLIDIQATGNLSYNNAGPILYADLILPLLLLTAVLLQRRTTAAAR